MLKESHAGQVLYRLYEFRSGAAQPEQEQPEQEQGETESS